MTKDREARPPAPEPERQRDQGTPGGGRGRRDEVRGSGVYPAGEEESPEER